MHTQKKGGLEGMPQDEPPYAGWGLAFNILAICLGGVLLLNYLLS